MKRIFRWISTIVVLIILFFFLFGKKIGCYYFGESRCKAFALAKGNISVPHARTINWANYSAFADSILNVWAQKPVPTVKQLEGKGDGPRILFAKLLKKKDIKKVNDAILQMKAWGVSGSSWVLNKKGDYDFVLVVLTPVLWRFGDDSTLLYPATRDHLIRDLLTEEGNKFRYTAPRTLGFVAETENHILMTEGSRYLKNLWLAEHGNKDPRYNNVENGMENKILDFLGEISNASLYEFNSNPYLAYTITALLNLEAFGSENVKVKARDVLDYINWCYALGSYELRHFPPFRRRYDKENFSSLTTDYASVFMKAWLCFSPIQSFDKDISKAEVHFLFGSCMPYRPPDSVVEMIFNKGNGYFIKIGHGPEACPEIYAAGSHYLLSAGGVNRGKRSLIVARPITLFVNDSAKDLSETFHLAGPGTDFMKWNNTGVYKNVACAAGPVSIPEKYKPCVSNKLWSVYMLPDNVCLAIHSTGQFGLMAVFEKCDPLSLANELLQANPDPELLKHSFKLPDRNKIEYNVKAPGDRWVMLSDNAKQMDRDYDHWPLIEGEFDQ